MKTKFFGKTNRQVKNKIEIMSEGEMKEIYGGVTMIAYKDADGNVRVIIIP